MYYIGGWGVGQEVELNVFDRVVMGDQLMLLRWPGGKEDNAGSPMEADEAVEEYQTGLATFRTKGGGGGGGNSDLDEERR